MKLADSLVVENSCRKSRHRLVGHTKPRLTHRCQVLLGPVERDHTITQLLPNVLDLVSIDKLATDLGVDDPF